MFSSRWIWNILCFIGGLALAIPLCTHAEGTDKVTFDLVPKELSIVRNDGSSIAEAALTVPSTVKIRDVTLSVAELNGIVAKLVRVGNPSNTEDYIWRISLTANDAAPADLQIPVALHYVDDKSKQHINVLADIHAKVAADPAALVSVKLEPGDHSTTEKEAGELRLFIENRSGNEVRVEDISAIAAPRFVVLDFKDWKNAVVLPGETKVISGETKISGPYFAKTYGLTERVILSTGAQNRKFEKTATTKIDIVVPGLSDVLKVIELPSLFLFPGLMMVAVANWLKSKLYAWKSEPDSIADWKDLRIWLVAITASAIISGIKYSISGRYVWDAYKLFDIFTIWIASITIAPLVYIGLLYAVEHLLGIISNVLHQREIARAPSPDDDPIQILSKLAKKGAGTYLPSILLPSDGGRTESAFISRKLPAGEGKVWAIPRAVFALAPGTSVVELDRIDSELDAGKSNPLCRSLKRIQQRKSSQPLLRIIWEGELRPRQIDVELADGKKTSAPRSFLRRGRW